MSIINVNNLTKYFGSDLILDHISFSVNKGERIALIGSNGSGKTTILKLILGEEKPTFFASENNPCSINILKNIKIGYLNQNAIENENNTVFDELLLAFKDTLNKAKEIDIVLEKISKNDRNLDTYILEHEKLLEEFKELRGYTYINEINEVINRFNFDKSVLERRISTLSGGEKMKIAFAKILLFRYDVLLLDEPTNHLDLSTILWLEKFLSSYKGTIIFVSHDIYFIRKIANKIFDLHNHKLFIYNTDYDTYLKLKEQKLVSEISQFNKEEKEAEKLRRFIEFYMPKPRFASRAKDRVKKLERLQSNRTVIDEDKSKNIKIRLKGETYHKKLLLSFDNVEVGYNKSLNYPFYFQLYGDERLAIVGDNGIGKTTLIKTIIGEIKPLQGQITEHRKLSYGYIRQNDYIIDEKLTIIEFFRQLNPGIEDSKLRGVLGSYYFKDEDIDKKISSLSNGEKTRLLIGNLSIKNYDILLLDEPTNHLDLDMKKSLIEALKNYKSAIIFTSHDRSFINNLSTNVLYFSKEETVLIEGNYDDLEEVINKMKETQKETSTKPIEIEKEIIDITKPKLSNNKILQLEQEAKEIEQLIIQTDLIINDPETMYIEINELSANKEKLESRLLEIMELLANN